MIRVTAALRSSASRTLAALINQPPHLRHCPAASDTTMTVVKQRETLDTDSLVGGKSPWRCNALNSGSNVAVCSLSQLNRSSALAPLHVVLHPGSKTNWTGMTERVPLRASQQLLGAGEVSGTFLLELQRGSLVGDGVAGAGVPSKGARPTLIVCSRTTMPWFLRPWIHTLAATVDGVDTTLHKVLHPCHQPG